ncbi:MAG: tRNA (N6-isopentenyl adenosine(37)-C2)-methylthiotransferase MiaB [Clostridia bacterium]|nr:tRNA (N6-isopentenyl adenosine(37)-C2)-methylthiotransferase MiaB [Clostridia bacterium]
MVKDFFVTEADSQLQKGFVEKVRSYNEGKDRFIFIQTFGCQQNEADSERICGYALSMGYQRTYDEKQADLIIVNTCAVREHAELKALSITGQLKHLKAVKPGLIVGICGCMVSQNHRKEDIKNRYPYVDFLMGTSMLWRFPEILWHTVSTGKRGFYLDSENEGNISEEIPVQRESSFKAWVTIMYGCNNFCTYCIVPYVRGRERSRKKECILEEVKELAEAGYKEITLLGQNVNSYGKELYEDYDFADLLSDICKIEGDFIVRFMTSHPKDATSKLIDVIASEPKIAKAFHLPLQSGSDRILKAMNRHYDFDHYYALVNYMREKMPDIAITTDIIVGFPGETEEDFAQTLKALELIRYDNIYSFIYSPRKGTKAAQMEQLPPGVASERFERMLALQNSISNEKNQSYLGTVQKVLVESVSKTDSQKLTGRNEKNRLIHFEGDESLIGSFADVEILKADTYSLLGKLK